MKFDRELSVILHALRSAAMLTESFRQRILAKQSGTQASKQKNGDDPVTLGDLGAQAILLFFLKKEFPWDGILAEESSLSLNKLGRKPRKDLVDLVGQTLGQEPFSEDDLAALIDWRGPKDPPPNNSPPLGGRTREAKSYRAMRGMRPGVGAVRACPSKPTVIKSWRSREPPVKFPERTWMIDPIDGTKGYRDGFSYVLAAGLCDKEKPVLGAMACPSFRIEGLPAEEPTLFWAIRNHGAFQRLLENADSSKPLLPLGGGRKEEGVASTQSLRVHTVHDPRDIIAVGSRANYDNTGPKRVLELLGASSDNFLVCDSQVKYALVANGRASLYIRPPHSSGSDERPWDHCAGVVIAEEAGARVTDFDGKPLDFSETVLGSDRLKNNRGTLISGGLNHRQILDFCRQAGL